MTFRLPDRTFLETNVDYLRKDGRQVTDVLQVTIPVVTVLERNGDLTKSSRIYFVASVYA